MRSTSFVVALFFAVWLSACSARAPEAPTSRPSSRSTSVPTMPTASWSPPWRTVDDPRQLPRPWPGAVAGLRSSVCPGVCAYDRHSPGDERILGWWGDEAVIFDAVGPGALTRLWMTTGDGRSLPLPDDVRLRIYLDGAVDGAVGKIVDGPRSDGAAGFDAAGPGARPVVDLPLSQLFDGSSPPFTPPLAFDRTRSSGGNVSHVPIPYRDACRVTLAGPGLEALKLWYQIDHLRLPSADGVVPFGAPGFARELEPLRRLLGAVTPATVAEPGAAEALADDVREADAWASAAARGVPIGTWRRGRGRLAADRPLALFAASRPGSLTGLRLELPVEQWRRVRLRLEVDGHVTVDERLSLLFGVRRAPTAEPLSTVFVRHDPDAGALALDFPMPWHRSVRLRLVWDELEDSASAPRRLRVRWRVRHLDQPPPADAMAFAVRSRGARQRPGAEPAPLPLLAVDGAGKWVGLAADFIGETGPRTYLEGDERVLVDAATRGAAPPLLGTGVEDFFAGGFYFDAGPFSTPLHGVADQRGGARRRPSTAALRLRLLDAVPFDDALRVELEAGAEGATPMRALAVAYLYLRPGS